MIKSLHMDRLREFKNDENSYGVKNLLGSLIKKRVQERTEF